MSLDVIQAVIAGYSDRLLDQEIMAVQTGYWAAYYSNAKHPKSVKAVAESLARQHAKPEKSASRVRPDVDVEAFLATEAAFKAKLLGQAGDVANG